MGGAFAELTMRAYRIHPPLNNYVNIRTYSERFELDSNGRAGASSLSTYDRVMVNVPPVYNLKVRGSYRQISLGSCLPLLGRLGQ